MPTSQAVQIYKASGLKDVINVSQQIDRMRVKKPGIIPCITPKGLFYDLSRDRLLVPTEKFMVMGFPVDRMDLSTLSARDSLPKRWKLICSYFETNLRGSLKHILLL